MLEMAEQDLTKVKDPYQHGMLTLTILDTYLKHNIAPKDVEVTAESKVEVKTEAKTKPAPKEEPKEVKPEDVIPTKADLKNEPPKATNLNPEAKVDVTEIVNKAAAEPVEEPTKETKDNIETNEVSQPEAPAPVVEPEPKAEIDITSPEWTEKHLTAKELDKSWTPAMKANKPLVESAARLKRVCINGIKSGKITVDWLNARVAECTGKHIMDFRTKDENDQPLIFNPRVVMIIESYISKKVTELFSHNAA